MIILGDVPVGHHGFGPSLYTKKGFAFYQRIIEAVHAEGCLVCAQLHQMCIRDSIHRGCYAVIDALRCVGCGKCTKICPANCITLLEREVQA